MSRLSSDRIARIGIACDFDAAAGGRDVTMLHPDYHDAIEAAGGLPILLPPVREAKTVGMLLDNVDGLLLTGGDDYQPASWGEPDLPAPGMTPLQPRRELFDLRLAKAAWQSGLPTLGICAGMQLINIVAGGTILPELELEFGGWVDHHAAAPEKAIHPVSIAPFSRLHGSTADAPRRVEVRSAHHQAIGKLGHGLVVSGRSDDGLPEVIETADASRWVVGIQWHAEKQLPTCGPDAPFTLTIFERLVRAARRNRRKKTTGSGT